MSHEAPLERSKGTYMLDSESTAEMTRLIRQDRLITQGMGGLFPERSDLEGIHRVLDIACGPGGWALEVAFTFPEVQVIGVDISQTMIAFARAQAQVQGLNNASFQVMDVTQRLDFPDTSFDLVNARALALFMPPVAWSGLMQECVRVLRPGGIIRLTDYEIGFTSAPAFEEISTLFTQGLKRAGQSFSPTGVHVGLVPMFGQFLRDAGCERIQHMAHAIDFSAGTEANQSFYHDMMVAFKLAEPFLLKWQVTTAEVYADLYQRMQIEILSEDFRSYWFVLTVWGHTVAKISNYPKQD